MKLEHVAINLPVHPKEVAQWYVDNLDMIVVRAQEEAPYMTFIADKNKASMMEIYHNTTVDLPDYSKINAFNLHFAFLVEDDMEAVRDRLVAAGATAEGDIQDTPFGDRLLFLRDPWNITVQLVQRKEPLL